MMRAEKKHGAFLILAGLMLLAGFLLTCPAHAQSLLTGEDPGQAQTRMATLYFRCGNSQWLEREQRPVPVSLSESHEKALVQALLDGPSQGSGLTPLFPQGTQVLSVITEGRQLFVTFNERLMAAYPDEGTDLSSPTYRAGEGRLRRKLAMASLVNTLTETGEYARVQVLVRAETTLTGSLRLSSRYYLEDTDTLPDPLIRQEAALMQPGNATDVLIGLWENREWTALKDRLAQAPGDAAAQSALMLALDASPVILQHTATPGIPGPDGSYAVVSLSLRYLDAQGREKSIENWPLRLIRQNGCWQLPWAGFSALLEACQ
ncbi:MAG: GerMN domain-containing protein [Christensenellales bacterium]|jgi:hypothetical protein